MAAFRTWRTNSYERIRSESLHRGGLRLVINRIRTDATNAAIWNQKKINVLESRVTFSKPIYDGDAFESLDQISETRQILAPLQVMGGGTGLHMLSVLDKQTAIAHASATWEETLDAKLQIPALTDQLPSRVPELSDQAVSPPPVASDAQLAGITVVGGASPDAHGPLEALAFDVAVVPPLSPCEDPVTFVNTS
jgi:hypothetical protein